MSTARFIGQSSVTSTLLDRLPVPSHPQSDAPHREPRRRGPKAGRTVKVFVAPVDGRQMMQAVANGEPGAFERLVKAYEPRIKAAVARSIGDRSQVDDLCQEVLLRLYRARHRYVPTARFETFLYRIIFNLCVNHTQYRRRRKALSLEQFDGDEQQETRALVDDRAVEPLDGVCVSERAALVRSAVERLPTNQRRAIVLSRFEGMAYEDIAQVIGMSTQAVKSLLWRARENLRRALLPRMGEEFATSRKEAFA